MIRSTIHDDDDACMQMWPCSEKKRSSHILSNGKLHGLWFMFSWIPQNGLTLLVLQAALGEEKGRGQHGGSH